MKKIISALHFQWDNLSDCCDNVINNLQLDGIEFSLDRSGCHPHLSDDDYKLLPSLKEKYNLIAEGHIWDNLAQLGVNDGVNALIHWADICNCAGITGIVIHGGSSDNQENGLNCTETIIETVIKTFEKKNVVLKLENHYAYDYKNSNELYSEPWEFIRLFNRIKSESLLFCFDTGHGHMTKNGCELITELKDRLSHVHLADNYGVDDDHCPYRKGSVPWDEYFKTLKEIGYNKTFCVEFPIFKDTEPFEQCISDIKRLF